MQGGLGSLAPAMRQSYDQAISAFLSFCASVGFSNPSPISEALLLHFLAFLKNRGLSSTTLNVHLSAFTFYSTKRRLMEPCRSFLVHHTVEGWRCSAPPAPDGWRPITIFMLEQLLTLLPSLCFSHFEATLFGAAFSLAPLLGTSMGARS